MKCTDCEFKKALSNSQKGKKLPGVGNGKCIREGGFCDEMEAEHPITDVIVASSNELAVQESQRLEQLEGTIRDNIEGFFRVGNALMEIRDQRLYRAEFDTFEEYCQVKWDIGRRHAYRQIDSVKVVDNLKSNVSNWTQNEDDPDENNCSQIILPMNEAQARPLTSLGEEAQIMVWQKVVEKAQGKRITAALVSRTAAEITKGFAKKKLETKTERIAREEVFSKPFRRGFQTFLDEVEKARASEWKETSKQATLKHLDELRKIVAES